MPRVKRPSSPFDQYDEDFEDDTCSSSSKSGNPPIQRNAANARERARMRVLSSAFGRLKTKLPNIPSDTKLSKLDTLRLATIYIKQLKTLVDGGGGVDGVVNSENNETLVQVTDMKTLNFQQCSQSMTWPFAFQHMHSNRQPTPQYMSSNWESQEDMTRKSQEHDSTISDSTNLFQGKCQINSNGQNSNNSLFDCLHQQHELSYYIHRNHYDYRQPEYSDNQSIHQNNQIH